MTKTASFYITVCSFVARMVCSLGLLWALVACQRPAAPCGHNWYEVSALVASHPDSAQRLLRTLPDSLLPTEAARQKLRLKNRLLQADPHLLDHHTGLDAWVHDF